MFSKMLDAGFTLRDKLEHLQPGLRVPMQLLTYHKTLFDAISKGTLNSKKRLMLNDACTYEGFQRVENRGTGFTPSSCSLADGLTNSMRKAVLLLVMKTSALSYDVDHWVIRRKQGS